MGCCCKITALVIVASVILAIILGAVLGSSVQIVPIGDMGLLMNTYTNVVDFTRVFEEGRYFNGPGHDYVLFPKYMKTIQYRDATVISTQTLDGLPLKLDISFNYKIIKTELPLLFQALLRGYENTLKSLAESAIRGVASQYRAVEFFYNRTEIGAAFHDAVNATLTSNHVLVPFLQMRQIDLPDAFEDAIVTTEVERQGVQTKQYQQQSATIRAQKGMIEATTDATIKAIQAETEAEITILAKGAEANATMISMGANAEANKYLMDTLGFNADQLLGYLYVDTLRSMPPHKILLNVKNALVQS